MKYFEYCEKTNFEVTFIGGNVEVIPGWFFAKINFNNHGSKLFQLIRLDENSNVTNVLVINTNEILFIKPSPAAHQPG